jgi:hypothetical protein
MMLNERRLGRASQGEWSSAPVRSSRLKGTALRQSPHFVGAHDLNIAATDISSGFAVVTADRRVELRPSRCQDPSAASYVPLGGPGVFCTFLAGDFAG